MLEYDYYSLDEYLYLQEVHVAIINANMNKCKCLYLIKKIQNRRKENLMTKFSLSKETSMNYKNTFKKI